MNVADISLCLTLQGVPTLSYVRLCRLLLYYGGVREVWESSSQEWPSLGLSTETIVALRQARDEGCSAKLKDQVQRQFDALQRLRAQVIAITDPAYPVLLRTIHDPPPLLYVAGDASVLNEAQLAVVGSRKASAGGIRAAEQLCTAAVHQGLHICSGLAQGIDGAAHRSAIAAGGRSLAVMATGLDCIYPYRHRELAAQLRENGALLTEFPPGVKPRRHNFPRRNRIISGLSLGVLVVEASLPSGSLITAQMGLEQGREVFALPWSMLHEGGKGCLQLIKDGATMVQTIDDITRELGPMCIVQSGCNGESDASSTDNSGNSPLGTALLSLLGLDATTVDELVLLCGHDVSRVQSELSILEVRGKVIRGVGGYVQV